MPLTLILDRQKEQTSKQKDISSLHFNLKDKLNQNQQDKIVEATIAKEFHRVSGIEDTNNKSVATNALLLRNYNDGRHGGWDNYGPIKLGSKMKRESQA